MCTEVTRERLTILLDEDVLSVWCEATGEVELFRFLGVAVTPDGVAERMFEPVSKRLADAGYLIVTSL